MNKKLKKKVPTRQGVKTLGKMFLYVSDFKITVTIIAVLLIISGMMSIFAGFGFGYFIDEIPGNAAAASDYFDRALVVACLYVLILGAVRYAQNYLLEKVAAQTIAKIRSDAFRNIVDQELEFFDGQSSGELQTRLVSDTNAFGQFVSSQIPMVLTASVRLIGGIAGALYIKTDLALIVLLALPIVFSPFLVVSPKMRLVSKMVQKANARIGQYSGEVFRSIKIMQAFNKKHAQKTRFTQIVGEVVAHTMRRVVLQLSITTLINTVAMTGVAFLFWYGAKDIHAGNIQTGEFVTFSYFVYLIITASGRMVSIISAVNFAVGAAEKIAQYLELEKCQWPSSISNFSSTGNIQFREVQFSYPSRPETVVLKGVNLDIEAGTHVVVVGPSGAGKSTLLELILRLYRPSRGQITIDNMDIYDLDVSDLRSVIGFVPQKETLVSGTVYENIAYGFEKSDLEKVREMARIVGLHEFIEELPHGYDSDLGEVADRLSGGQKQRLSLARALIRNPKILLLDEANSALDAESEQAISSAIRTWAVENNTTILTIAHRLSTARQADKIVVMKSGRIVDQGTHDELIGRCAIYCTFSAANQDHNDELQPSLSLA